MTTHYSETVDDKELGRWTRCERWISNDLATQTTTLELSKVDCLECFIGIAQNCLNRLALRKDKMDKLGEP